MMGIQRIDGIDMIPLRDVALWQDVECCRCGRIVALSNAIRQDGHYECPNCPGERHRIDIRAALRREGQ